ADWITSINAVEQSDDVIRAPLQPALEVGHPHPAAKHELDEILDGFGTRFEPEVRLGGAGPYHVCRLSSLRLAGLPNAGGQGHQTRPEPPRLRGCRSCSERRRDC